MTLTILAYEPANAPITFEFLMETFKISFGTDKSQWPNDLGSYSLAQYSKDLSDIKEREPRALWTAWLGSEIVGQVEVKSLKSDNTCGYVSFYYLSPQFRGKGLASQLDEFAINEFRSRGYKRARLTVSTHNNRAQGFYEKCGWKVVGPDPNRPFGITMEKIL